MISQLGVGALSLALALQSPTSVDRLYGTVTTVTGERYEGWLRWDRNETNGADLLDGRGTIPREHAREAERLDEELRRRRELERSISLPGLRITWDEDDTSPDEPTAMSVRFGHIRSLEKIAERRVRLTLLSGAEHEMASSSTDLGPSFRGLIVEGPTGEAEVEWDALARVDFAVPPPGRLPPTVERLHGTLHTRGGLTITGFVAWDIDESLGTDVLDGDVNGERMRIAFRDVASIAPVDDEHARVTLRSGEVLVLDDTNDVNEDNRGIEITEPSFGRVVVQWGELASLELHPPVEPYAATFDTASPAGDRLRGTVTSRGAAPVTGTIRWDNDEEHGWEMIWGMSDDVQVVIELSRIRSIERYGTDARVTLRDGRVWTFEEFEGDEDSGDLSERNRGIFVGTDSGETVLVRWRDLIGVTFEP